MNKQVLVVEDEPMVMEVTADLLIHGGHGVVRASSYDEAMQALESSEAIDMLVTDISIPGEGDGLTLAREVAERWPDLRVVIVSGQCRPELKQCPPAALFFTKPYAPGALLAAADGALA